MLKATKTSQTCWYCAENRRYMKCMYHWHRAAAVELSPPIIRLLLRGLDNSWFDQDLQKTVGCCGSEFCRLHPIWKTCVSITSPPASPLCWGGRGWWWVCSAALVRQKKDFPQPKCGLLFEACRILKVRNRDVQETPRVSLPEAVSTFALRLRGRLSLGVNMNCRG